MLIQRDVLIALRESVVGSDSPNYDLEERIFAIAYGWSHPLVGAAYHQFRDLGERTRFTSSIDAVVGLVEYDDAYQEDRRAFLTECAAHAPPHDFDLTKPLAPQSARHMLIGYLGAKIALLAQETAHV